MNEKQYQKSCDKCGCNDGICCEVTNCMYHDGKNHCKADVIHVGPQFAVSNQDTTCATFRCK